MRDDQQTQSMRADAMRILNESLQAVQPDAVVAAVLGERGFNKCAAVISIGKAAWNMADIASRMLKGKIRQGLVVTKSGHSKGGIPGFEIIEAGHPVPDERSILGAERALAMVAELSDEDAVLFLISGGGSALFEKPLEGVSLEEVMEITRQLLASGADIREMNTVRKHLSSVKGGRFGEACRGKEILAIVLSDVIGDPLDVIASGPVFPDASTSGEAFRILEKYHVRVADHVKWAIALETPKQLPHCEYVIAGSVPKLCESAAKAAHSLGYQPIILSSSIDCEAREAGRFLAAIARDVRLGTCPAFMPERPCAVIAGGETIVRLRGGGKGGRNQEAALAAALGIEGLKNVVILCAGSDGTDGPTEAAGGLADGVTAGRIRAFTDPEALLDQNDSYHALKIAGDLIITGPTGTNVNDLMLILIK
jgi:hydroxypyruvate reductase